MSRLLEKIGKIKANEFIFFEASTGRLAEKEIRDINNGKTAEFIRGTVTVRREIPNTRLIEIVFRETNVSFGRFEREVINKAETELKGVWIGY